MILLLLYRNDPYRQVYDTIKIIDQNNAVGVMHIGDFPNGTEFATVVLTRRCSDPPSYSPGSASGTGRPATVR